MGAAGSGRVSKPDKHDKIDVDTPLGWGKAFMIESRDNDYYWNVVLADTGAVVCFPQNKIKWCRHYTFGINFNDQQMREVIGG